MDTIINLDNVSFSYAHIPVLRDITLAIGEGEFLGVIGPNAGGKSTLLKLILGLLQPDKGDIKVFGKSPDKG
ncbi:MAG: ATP-binding cassette domain-containing protein, partial [Proteobacteria bacterium]|nr:ATP-binding cassette domain-containing protein [Pseudomonadota bacterium]